MKLVSPLHPSVSHSLSSATVEELLRVLGGDSSREAGAEEAAPLVAWTGRDN